MSTTWLVITSATAVLFGTIAVAGIRWRIRSRLSPLERARHAARQLARDSRARRGRGSRGTGDHFGNINVEKFGAEQHSTDNLGDSGGGSSW